MRLPGAVLQGILARHALVFLRIYLGVVFLYSGWIKMSAAPPLLLNRPSLASLVSLAELLVGGLLVIGLATRLIAALAAVILINDLLAGGRAAPSLGNSSQLAFTAIALALLVGAAGRTLGFDSMLARRWPRSPLW